MAKLILKFEDRVLKEIPVGAAMVKIGRVPDNTVMIDNPAVSSHHARVFRDGDSFVLEDLQSTNGTFVNDNRVTRHTLANGDIIAVGKHRLVFERGAQEEAVAEAAPSEEAPVLPELGGTVFLDTKAQRELMAKIQAQAVAQGQAAPAAPTAKTPAAAAAPAAPARVGVLTVLAGKVDQREYRLESATSVIGKSDTALVRLKGWFKPKLAAAIARKGEHYTVTPLGGKTLVNKQPLTGRHELKDGDVLEVSGLTLQFNLQ